MFSDSFDRSKSERTQADRGIDFVQARVIWLDPSVRTVPARMTEGQIRYATIGFIGDKLWVAIWTDESPEAYADPSQEHEPKIRIISVHRAEGTKFERGYYGKD